jgi:hypothetical protein
MIKSGMIFRGRPYVKVCGSWYLLVTIAATLEKKGRKLTSVI